MTDSIPTLSKLNNQRLGSAVYRVSCVCVSVLSCFTVWVVLFQNSVHVHTWDRIFVRFFIWISPSQTYVANQYSPGLILIL